MKASEAAAAIRGARIRGTDREFSRLRADSLSIRPGEAFIALKGSVTDGHEYINDAVDAGASVVICRQGGCILNSHATAVEVPDTKSALGKLLPLLYPEARRLRLMGITGTNGKTTTTYLLESVLKAAGRDPGVIGTINMRYHDVVVASSVTTPGPLDLFEQLHAMAQDGADTCIMEVSSHSLDQDRVMGLMFDCGVFTNLSQDHLDYHKDMEAYFHAKRKLFDNYLKGTAVINADDPFGQRLISDFPDCITYGRWCDALVRTRSVEHTSGGMRLELSSPVGVLRLNTRLVGDVNAYNIMACVGASLASGIDKRAVVAGIESLAGVPGRMEPVENRFGLTILVDFAHTPDALKNALASARSLAGGRLISIFGCGGNRDRAKRPVMGSIAEGTSDIVIVTSDNPRKEDPKAIIEDILDGIEDRSKVMVEPDRSRAIRLGITLMKPDDCLLIAGKGHETYQIIGAEKRPFDDRTCVTQCLEEIYGP